MIIDAPGRRVYPVNTMLKTIFNRPNLLNPQTSEAGLHRLGLREKRRAVVKYLSGVKFNVGSCENTNGDKFMGIYKYSQLYDMTIKDLVDNCGDDLDKIRSNFGIYGLAEYAHVAPQKFIRSIGKIEEAPFTQSSTFRSVCYEYLLNNDIGTLNNLYIRFGKLGVDLCADLQTMDLIESENHCYKVSDLGKKHLASYEAINSCEFKNRLDQHFANQYTFLYNNHGRRGINESTKNQSA